MALVLPLPRASVKKSGNLPYGKIPPLQSRAGGRIQPSWARLKAAPVPGYAVVAYLTAGEFGAAILALLKATAKKPR